jgi:hypothetical protein
MEKQHSHWDEWLWPSSHGTHSSKTQLQNTIPLNDYALFSHIKKQSKLRNI